LNKKTPARSELALSDWVRVEEPGFYWVLARLFSCPDTIDVSNKAGIPFLHGMFLAVKFGAQI
jgi:hypothetical protein